MQQQRQMLDRMHSDNAEVVRRIAREISARLDALEAGEVVKPMIRRPAVADPDAPDDEAYRIGYRAARTCSDAIWARVDELGLRVRALMARRPLPRVRVAAGGDMVVVPPASAQEEAQ